MCFSNNLFKQNCFITIKNIVRNYTINTRLLNITKYVCKLYKRNFVNFLFVAKLKKTTTHTILYIYTYSHPVKILI